MKNRSPFKNLLNPNLLILIILSIGFIPSFAWASFLTSSGRPLAVPTDDFFPLPLELKGLFFEESSVDPVRDLEKTHTDHDMMDAASLTTLHELIKESNGLLRELDALIQKSEERAREEKPAEEIVYDVPIVINEDVEGYLNYFQTKLRDKFALWLSRSGRYLPMMKETFRQYDLPEDLVYVALIESGFNPYAYSRARAVGPWQFIKGTGRLYGLRINRWIDERRDPVKSTDAAARHLKDLYEHFNSWPLALASYNAGQRRIQHALQRARTNDYWDLQHTRYIRRETKNYVPKFMAATIIAKNPERFGFSIEYQKPFVFDEVTVPGLADLHVIAKAVGVQYKDLKSLNPELRTEVTPPHATEYILRLPSGSKERFKVKYAEIPDHQKLLQTGYVVKRNDTLSEIAARFGTTVGQLARTNNRSPRKFLRVGEILLIPLSETRRSRPIDRKAHVQVVSNDADLGNGTEAQQKILYRVQVGDTLWDIAESFKIRLKDLMHLNDMNRRGIIYPGDLIVLGYDSLK